MDIAELNRMLVSRGVPQICQYVLPSSNWRRVGHEFKIGDIYGSAGDSLSVRIDGNKAGRWGDFASGGELEGDLVGFWRRVRDQDFGATIREIKTFLGVQDAPPIQKKDHKRPPAKDPARRAPKPAGPDEGASPVFEYLTGDRFLSPKALKDFRIAEKTMRGETFICFPYLSPDGEVLNVKYLNVKRGPDGKKDTRQEADAQPSLFGWQAVDPAARAVVITEGEIDAMTWNDVGFSAL